MREVGPQVLVPDVRYPHTGGARPEGVGRGSDATVVDDTAATLEQPFVRDVPRREQVVARDRLAQTGPAPLEHRPLARVSYRSDHGVRQPRRIVVRHASKGHDHRRRAFVDEARELLIDGPALRKEKESGHTTVFGRSLLSATEPATHREDRRVGRCRIPLEWIVDRDESQAAPLIVDDPGQTCDGMFRGLEAEVVDPY